VPETNIVLVSVADLPGTLHRLENAGVRATPMSGQVRFVTHADISDADIAAALERIGPVETSNGVPDQRARLRGSVGRAPVRPGGR
jgi:threonine aldolase